MIHADTIIEKQGVFLRNLATPLAADTWSTANGNYGCLDVPYEVPLGIGKLYYLKFTYKFTTTNQSPTWVQFYIQDGMVGGPTISNPTAGTEYTVSSIGSPQVHTILASGTVYQGASSAINGVSGQVKNILIYDVTELFEVLRATNIATTTAALKTWCDNNLVYSPRYTNYNITAKVTGLLNKVDIKGGAIIADRYIEPDGMRFFSANLYGVHDNEYFDKGTTSGLYLYNNNGNGTVTHTIVSAAAQNSPFASEHPYIVQVKTNGSASPGGGGFGSLHQAAANKIFVQKFVAKLPTNFYFTCHYNAQGTGASVGFIGSNAGTGNWEEYTVLYRCGSEGSFSSGGYIAVYPSDTTSVTWYLAYQGIFDITSDESLKNFSVLGNKERIKSGTIFSRKFDIVNLTPQLNGYTQFTLPSGWSWDTSDVAGNAVASIVQEVNGGGSVSPIDWIPVVGNRRYKISYWVKCKRDMSSFLTAIRIKCGSSEITHGNVAYKAGTKTTLSAALNTGATSMTVANAANWGAYNYSRIGFRNNTYTSSWNDKGTSNGYNGSTGLIKSVSGNTITFNAAYSGSNMPAGTVVVESFDGGTYPYPIGKESLPTDNTWKYVEGYFGGNSYWDGAGGNWASIPYGTTAIALYLNLYTNNGSVPIKYSDIRIEPVSSGSLTRYENKIQIIGGN